MYSVQRTIVNRFKVPYYKIPLICHLIIWNHDNPALEESSPKTGSFALYQNKLHHYNRQISGICSKRQALYM
jgi:hypothetical protein